jgi:hypothetical protein
MSDPYADRSDLIEIARLNGDFRRNYGRILGAILYLRSVSAARRRSTMWTSGLFALLAGVVAWIHRHGWPALS